LINHFQASSPHYAQENRYIPTNPALLRASIHQHFQMELLDPTTGEQKPLEKENRNSYTEPRTMPSPKPKNKQAGIYVPGRALSEAPQNNQNSKEVRKSTEDLELGKK